MLSQEELDQIMKLTAGEDEQSAVSKNQDEGRRVFSKKDSNGNPKNLDVILDVPMKGEVVLGKTQRSLKELLSLKPGTIIETDNSVQEYVQLCVNGCVIALGEVIVTEENYGFRVKKIINPVERVIKLR